MGEGCKTLACLARESYLITVCCILFMGVWIEGIVCIWVDISGSGGKRSLLDQLILLLAELSNHEFPLCIAIEVS